MPAWKAYFQINGYDFTRYPVVEFPVPEDLYAQIQTAISGNLPLRLCPFHDELLRLAQDAINLDDYRPEYEDLFPNQAEVTVAGCTIEDPGDLKRLNDRFRGLVFPNWPDSSQKECMDANNIYRNNIILQYDDDGAVRDITVWAEGLESESDKSSSLSACYPDYDLITDFLQKEYERQNA